MKPRNKIIVTTLAVLTLLAVITSIAFASTLFYVKQASLDDVQGACENSGGFATSWHFVITQMTDETAPATIHVYWDNGQDAWVDLEKVAGGSAHYTTSLNAGWTVTDATALLPDNWLSELNGQFNLSHVTCTQPIPLDPTKTAEPSFDRTWSWTIDKKFDGNYVGFAGDVFTHNYAVTVTPTSVDGNWEVNGVITIINPNPFDAYVLVSDAVDNGGTCDVVNSVVTVPANGQVQDGYTCTYATEPSPSAGTNTATIAWGSHDYYATANFDFSTATPTELGNPVITIDDTNLTGESWSANRAFAEWDYSKSFACPTNKSLYTNGKYEFSNVNTATINETGANDSATVDVTCYVLDVTKDAHTSFTRTYDWTIHKTGDQTALTLEKGQQFTVNYSVIVDATYVDSAWAVDGTITISNPATIAAHLSSVTDVVSPDIAASVDCPSLVVPANDTLVCTYHADLPNASNRTNTATVVLQNSPSGTTPFSGSADVLFAGATKTEIDRCIDVTDTYAGFLGHVCYPDVPRTFTYPRVVGPYATCGNYEVNNTASFVTNDTAKPGSSSWTVNVNVPCNGCSLTIGYWKTHAGFGPQADMVTQYLPKFLGTQLFGVPVLKSVKVSTAGQAVDILSFNGLASNGINKLYAQLLGVKLNIAAGASGSSISSSITAADLFLTTHNAADWASLTNNQKKAVLAWMTTFDNYNNGLIGPGHCSQ